jgi:hypothetical protein
MPVQTLTCILSFCCKSGGNRKTQPCYWLATNNTRRKLNKNTTEETEHTAKDSKGKHRTEHTASGFTRSSPFTRLYKGSFRILQMLKFKKGIPL